MAIEHKNIPEEGLHEPKGIAFAPSNRVYVSQGNGTGQWNQVGANVLKGDISDALPSGRFVVTDGDGGLSSVEDPGSGGTSPTVVRARGVLAVTNNETSFSVPAATGVRLNNPTDYQDIGSLLSSEDMLNMTAGSNFLQINQAGLYRLSFWTNARASVMGTRLGFKAKVNADTFVTRGGKDYLHTADEVGNISFSGIRAFAEGDVVRLTIASSKLVDVTLEDLGFALVLEEAL